MGGGGGGGGGGHCYWYVARGFKKGACYLWGFFFSQKTPDFKNSSWIFFYLKEFLKLFREIQRAIFISFQTTRR